MYETSRDEEDKTAYSFEAVFLLYFLHFGVHICI